VDLELCISEKRTCIDMTTVVNFLSVHDNFQAGQAGGVHT
jgi:hypothetical protein